MKLRFLSSSFALLAGVMVVACASSSQTIVGNPNDPNGLPTGETSPEEEDDDPANQPPHSLGSIVLGESHASVATGATRSTPVVHASFLPDAMLGRACKTKLEGCEIVKAPKCNKVTTSANGCGEGEACSWDTACKAVCKKVAICDKACDADEVCTLPSSGTSTKATCVKRESFDAGPLAFSGTTTPITLFPPYAYESDGKGAPFLAGAEIHVQASGATEAGFEAFDEKFKATKFLQTTPTLAKIPREKIFGTGSIPIAWAAGEDTILVTVSGIGGSATCKVKDALGKFDVPRAVVKAVQTTDAEREVSTQSLSITVTRQRKETRKDKKAKGTLEIAEVQPDGWLDLVTFSTESASFQGCPGTQSICGDTCADLKTDPENCGTCGNVCPGSQSCNAGKCGGSQAACESCISSASSGTCNSSRAACQADAACSNLVSCLGGCGTNTTCQNNCRTTHAAGVAKFNAFDSCLASVCASACE
ncbi:MAG: hypothetical protein KF819_03350 [Labilithrix sp.]|nr:hypothetical protein [Labilithrix sp.]